MTSATIPALPPDLAHAGLACAFACREACVQLRTGERGAVLVFDIGGGMPRVFTLDSCADARAQLAGAAAQPSRVAVVSWFVRLHRPAGPLALALHIEPSAGAPVVFVSEVGGSEPFSTWQRLAGTHERIGREAVLQ